VDESLSERKEGRKAKEGKEWNGDGMVWNIDVGVDGSLQTDFHTGIDHTMTVTIGCGKA